MGLLIPGAWYVSDDSDNLVSSWPFWDHLFRIGAVRIGAFTKLPPPISCSRLLSACSMVFGHRGPPRDVADGISTIVGSPTLLLIIKYASILAYYVFE